METKIFKIKDINKDNNLIKEAGEMLKNGKLVSFPTETVYGLGANGLCEDAVKNIYKAKGRPSDNPLILHISSIEELAPLVREIPKEAEICIKEFWPGPLTMIFKRSNLVPDCITGGLDTVAIRMPDNEIAREIIKYAKVPIAAPSANTSGRPSPTTAKHVIDDLYGKIDCVVDGGKCIIGLESTVLDLSEDIPIILRPGKISIEDLKKHLKEVSLDKSIIKQGEIPKSPGQKYKHYAPKGEMYLYVGDRNKIAEEILKKAKEILKDNLKLGILATDENMTKYKELSDLIKIESLGSVESPETIANSLFDKLRYYDEIGVDYILAEGVDTSDIGMAIMNRLTKASGGNIIRI